MSLVVVVNCGAANALRGFEISMFYFFLKLYFIHISKNILLLRAQNAIQQCKWYFLESRNAKDYENVKLVNLSSSTAAQLPLMLCMISKNSDFGVGGHIKFFYRSEFYTHEHKIHQSEPEDYPRTICIYTKLIYGTVFEMWSNLCRKVAPHDNPEKQAKKWNSLISASKYQKYTKFTSRYMCLWLTNAMQWVKISLRITKDVNIQDGRQLWFKNSFRYQASSKIPKLWNLTHTPTHLVCNIHLIANFLSFHMSLVIFMHFRAGNVLHGIEISMFWFY